MTRLETTSDKKTQALGTRLGKKIKSGCVIALEGTLGAGKTQFVKGLAKGLGVRHIIQSPTFVLMRVYPVQKKNIKHLVHVDCYRLASADDLVGIGLEDYIASNQAVVVIEWANKVRKLLPKEKIQVRFFVTGEKKRRIIFDADIFATSNARGTGRQSPSASR